MKTLRSVRTCLTFAIAASTFLASREAAAEGTANGFGEKGQLILSADRLVPVLSFTHASATQTFGNRTLTSSRSATGISLLFGRNFGSAVDNGAFAVNVHTLPRVAADYVVIPHLTLGGAIAFGFGLGGSDQNETVQGAQTVTRSTDAPRATAIGFAPRVGYVIPLTDLLALWPRGGLGIYSVSVKQDTTNDNGVVTETSVSDTLFSLDAECQLAIVPLEHFFFTVGPLINIPLSGSRTVKTTTGASTTSTSNDVSLFQFGITATIGGWFDL